jgi:hypothetical protein
MLVFEGSASTSIREQQFAVEPVESDIAGTSNGTSSSSSGKLGREKRRQLVRIRTNLAAPRPCVDRDESFSSAGASDSGSGTRKSVPMLYVAYKPLLGLIAAPLGCFDGENENEPKFTFEVAVLLLDASFTISGIGTENLASQYPSYLLTSEESRLRQDSSSSTWQTLTTQPPSMLQPNNGHEKEITIDKEKETEEMVPAANSDTNSLSTSQRRQFCRDGFLQGTCHASTCLS